MLSVAHDLFGKPASTFPDHALKHRKPFRRDEDQQPDEAADQCPVDADVLQILADLQLKPVDQRRGIPVMDDPLDIASDLEPIEQQKLLRDG